MEGQVRGQNKRDRHAINQSALYRLASHRRLAEQLRISVADLRKLRHSDQLYKEFDVPKKSAGVRRVENPSRPLKRVQARIARLLARIEPPGYLYCPVKARSYVSNAAQHRHNRA